MIPARTIATLLLLWVFHVSTAEISLAEATAEQSSPEKVWEPQPCIGLRTPVGTPVKWGAVGIARRWDRDDCPKGYAYVNAEPTGGRFGSAEVVPIVGTCCELPPDALTKDKLFALVKCPEGYVATGARALPAKETEWHVVPKALHCTRINTERYMLGEPSHSVHVTAARELADMPFLKQFIGEFAQFNTTSGRIPAGLRYAIGRIGWRRWSTDTCTGYPWGSLLVAKAPRSCNFTFRQLQYRGLPNDPSRGSPVKLFPDCDYLDNPLSPTPLCIKPPAITGQ